MPSRPKTIQEVAQTYLDELCAYHHIVGIDCVSEYDGRVVTVFARYEDEPRSPDPILPREVTSESLYSLLRIAGYLKEQLDHGEIARFNAQDKSLEISLASEFGMPRVIRQSVVYPSKV